MHASIDSPRRGDSSPFVAFAVFFLASRCLPSSLQAACSPIARVGLFSPSFFSPATRVSVEEELGK